jgi:3-deoxy-manno-octulosonate cytidylyltransferase (CMP-KDO synthetase)
MKFLAVIPARYDSKRFPGKSLALLDGRPMIQWVNEATQRCQVFDSVVVATDDQRIADAVTKFGGEVAITRADHETGTDRVAEVSELFPEFDVVVNVQGDQPFVNEEMLEQLVAPYRHGETPEMTTVACPFQDESSAADPNAVKVVCNQGMQALYFSRSPIPYYRQQHEAPVYHHLGLYAFRQDFLRTYSSLSPTPLELCEQLEQLRVLENGFSIRVTLVDKPAMEVNTPEELVLAQQFLDAQAANR